METPLLTQHEPTLVSGTAQRNVIRFKSGGGSSVQDDIATEVPVELLFNNISYAVMMMTPLDLEDFALGFSISEGLVDHAEQVLSIEINELIEGYQIYIGTTAGSPAASLNEADTRLMPGRSSCGICGSRELERVLSSLPIIKRKSTFDARLLDKALALIDRLQPLNQLTGSVHAACWVDQTGCIVEVREDVGRHNALDKLIGALSRSQRDTSNGMLLLTSRASYEMVTKAARAGMGTIAAISGPTALAVDLAKRTGMTLVGFARRGGNYTVYSGDDSLNAKR